MSITRQTFSGEIRAAGNRTIELSFSSETPYMRSCGLEILSHAPGAVDMTRMKAGAALLLEHDPEQQIGVVEKAWIDYAKRQGRAIVRFSKNPKADEVFTDVKDGIRALTSVGYNILKSVQTADGLRATRWTPLEISIVSIPADMSVGVGRSVNNNKKQVKPMIASDIKKLEEERDAISKKASAIVTRSAEAQRDFTPDENELHSIYTTEARRLSVQLNEKRSELGRLSAIAMCDSDSHAPISNGSDDSMNIKNYSLTRALSGAAAGRLDGLEGEWSQELTRRNGRNPMGVFIPLQALATRGMSATGGTNGSEGGNLYTPQTGSFIDALRPRLQVAQLGATVLANLTSDVKLPRQAAASTASWATETSALDEESPEIDQVSLSPKRVGAFTQFSKQLLVQSDGSVESLVRNDLLSAVAIAIDAAAIAGTGQNNQPTGILSSSGLTKVPLGVAGAVPSYASIVALLTAIANANADAGVINFLTNPSVRSKLMNMIFDAGSGQTLWDKVGSLGKWGISTNCPANLTKSTGTNLSAIIAGDFSQVIICQFGSAADVVVDPYTRATEGITRVVVHAFADVAIRRAAYLAAITDAITV